jgi:hypothetical protein
MVYVLATGNRAANGGAVANICKDELNAIEWKMIHRRAGTIKNANRLAAINEKLNEVRADKPGAAGDEEHKKSRLRLSDVRKSRKRH